LQSNDRLQACFLRNSLLRILLDLLLLIAEYFVFPVIIHNFYNNLLWVDRICDKSCTEKKSSNLMFLKCCLISDEIF